MTTNELRSAREIHTIFGAGQIGRKLIGELLARGHEVRIVRRGPAGPARASVTWLSGDVTDAAFAAAACQGASVVYNCVNPPDYHRWEGVLEPMARGIRSAAARAGARLVVLDNLYMYGAPDRVMTEDTPMNPNTKKGELRALLARELFEAHDRGDLRVTSGRPSDYFGPDTPNAVFGDRFFPALLAGKAPLVLGNPDRRHSYAYTPDVARDLAILGDNPSADGRAWLLTAAHQGSTRELATAFSHAAGVRPRLRAAPRWMVRLAGIFSTQMRAIVEMMPQWEQDYVVDDSRFRERFGVTATPLATAVVDTLAAAQPGCTLAEWPRGLASGS